MIKNKQAEYAPMTWWDVRGVWEVENEVFPKPWSLKAFEDEMENDLAHYYVVKINGKVAGYAGCWMILDEAHITNIAVLPAFRGCKHGKNLVKLLIRTAKELGGTKMTLEVRKSNQKAISLYEGLGFYVLGTRKEYYHDKEDALIMWKDINVKIM
jgi:ribosomal-protein-alanine N-acetyltransferase